MQFVLNRLRFRLRTLLLSIAMLSIVLGYYQAHKRWAYFQKRAEHFADNAIIARSFAKSIRLVIQERSTNQHGNAKLEASAAEFEKLADEYTRKLRYYETRW